MIACNAKKNDCVCGKALGHYGKHRCCAKACGFQEWDNVERMDGLVAQQAEEEKLTARPGPVLGYVDNVKAIPLPYKTDYEVAQQTKPVTDEVPALAKAVVTGLPKPLEVIPDQGIIPSMQAKAKKLKWSLMPWGALECVARVFAFGAVKHAPQGWRAIPNCYEEYRDAAQRHLAAIMQGQVFDPETGETHAAHLACCALIMDDALHAQAGTEADRG